MTFSTTIVLLGCFVGLRCDIELPSYDVHKRILSGIYQSRQIANGTVDCSGDPCKLTCDPGFSPDTHDVAPHWCWRAVECFAGKVKCIAKRCRKPPSISFGSLHCSSSHHEYKSTCKLTCSTGYRAISSHTTTTCLSTGTWSTLTTCDYITCQTPSDSHGSYRCTSTQHKPDETCTLHCNEGYTHHGTSRITCQSSGKWTNHPPCVGIVCPKLTTVHHGSLNCSRQHTHVYGSTCTLTCDEGYTPSNSHTTSTCGAASQWSSLPSCDEIMCPKHRPVPHGSLNCPTEPDHKFGSTCTLTCDPGYTPSNSHTTSTCGATSQWSRLSSCSEIVCPKPSPVQHGSLTCSTQQPHKFGSTCTLTCDTGFEPRNSHTTSTCGATSKWSSLPNCTRIKCLKPPTVTHGSLNCSRQHTHVYGSTCTLTCAPGYKPSNSHTTSTCGAASKWSSLPSCDEIFCTEPPAVPHGSLNCSSHQPYKFGTTCTLICDSEHKASKWPAVTTCGSKSMWSSLPVCYVKQCPDLPKIMHGSYHCPNNSKVYRQHEICDLRCDPGYKPDSWVVHIECSRHETWTASAKCVENKCPSPPNVENGHYSCGNTSHYGVGSTCELHCNQGYRLNSEDGLISCGVSETWSKSPSCIEITCTEPPRVTNGSYHCDRETHKEGDNCSLQCNEGYTVTSTKTITCLPSSSWSTGGSCEEKQCPSLPTVHKGRWICPHNSSHKPHDICDLSCDIGYKPDSLITHTVCLTNETWTPSATCKEILCQDPPSVTNGMFSCVGKSTYRMQDTCDLHCDNGYKPDSNIVHTRCLSTGTWSTSASCEAETTTSTTLGQSTSTTTTTTTPTRSSTVPTTQEQKTTTIAEKQCPFPTIDNGRFICPHNSTHKPHDICDLSCDLGYKPDSLITHTECLSTGTWTASATCKEILCQEPPAVTNGKFSCDKSTHRLFDTCDLHCDNGYKPDSNMLYTRCLSTGTWSTSALCEETITSSLSTTSATTTIPLSSSTTRRKIVQVTETPPISRIPSTLSTQQEQTTTSSIDPVGCEVCSGPVCGIIPNNDSLVTCPADKPYCMNHVDNKSDGTKTVTKICASAVDCNIKWWHETSDKSDCVDFNPKNIYSYYLSCYYCCTEDGCNRDVVPARKTLFLGHD